MDVSGKMQMPDEDGKMKDVQFKGSGIRARATLLRMHELAQIQIPVVTDRCRTPQLPWRSETEKRSSSSCARTPIAERHECRNGPTILSLSRKLFGPMPNC